MSQIFERAKAGPIPAYKTKRTLPPIMVSDHLARAIEKQAEQEALAKLADFFYANSEPIETE